MDDYGHSNGEKGDAVDAEDGDIADQLTE